MNPLLNEIQRIITDLRAEKPTTRNKAVEQLDQKLNSSRDAVNAALGKCQELSWQTIFDAAKDSIFKHAANLQDANEKSFKTLSDKCYLYGNVMDKIIDYNLEMGRGGNGHFLLKSSIFNAFEEGIKQRIVVRHFGDHFINMLDRGIFLSQSYIAQLKVSEYSRILSYLFELNVDKDEFLRSKILKCITKTLQSAQQRVQLHADLVDYLPTLSSYTQTASSSERKTEIVRLYQIFVAELSVNYHHKLCMHMQEIMPKLCDFHNDDSFRDDTKRIFFECVILSLQTLYPKLKQHDFGTFQVPLNEDWPQTMQQLRTIVNMEIRKNCMGRGKESVLNSDKFSDTFIRMAALVVFIVQWHIEPRGAEIGIEVPSKRPRVDKLEVIIELIDKQETSFNAIWFAIFAELLQLSNTIINVANYQQSLLATLDVLLIYGNGKNLHNVRLCLTSMLDKERELLQTKSIPADFMADQWSKIATHLISETRPAADEILEKQIILQTLIKHGKLSPTLCATLLQSITTNEMLRRNECIETMREIFIHAEQCGLDKASGDLEPIIKWAYASETSSALQMIYYIAAIDTQLLADTFAIGIINFLDEQQLQQLCSSQAASATTASYNLQLLLYKYNKQLVCLDETFQAQLLRSGGMQHTDTDPGAKNCLFQQNYELLMRMLNLTPSSEHTTTSMLKDLRCLHKLVCTMERLLHYKVFDAENLTHCPLIKRIGLFLSHIEFQYKANQSEISRIDDSDLRDILQQQIVVLDVFNSNDILLQYLEKQPIEMLLEFIGVLLNQICTRKDIADSIEHATLTSNCLHILGSLCANSSYNVEAFRHIAKNLKIPSTQQHVLLVIRMLCKCKSLSQECIVWLVEKLKIIFLYHHTNVDYITEVVEHLPTVIYFVYKSENQLDDMLSALISLMRIALRKAYPAALSVKIVLSVGLIAQRCPNIYDLPNFHVICFSVAKFLTMPTLEIRFATVATLTQLLNTNYCVSDKDGDTVSKCASHLVFCEQLYGNIDWKKLTFISEDLVQNNHAVAIQSFIAFFAFSTFHQEVAVQDLLPYCALHKLNENAFCALESFVHRHKSTMRQLLTPYADCLLHKWHSLRWAVSKFPYFLCYDTREEFIRAHSKSIMAYTFIYGKPDDIIRYKKFINERDAMPILKAFMVADLCDCTESEGVEFRAHHENLKQNLEHFQLKPMDLALNATTLYQSIRMLLDKDELARLFGGAVPSISNPLWFHLTAKSLFMSLYKLVKDHDVPEDDRIQSMSALMCEQPLILVSLLGTLKSDCYRAVLPSHVLHCFFLYCTIGDAILDTAKALESAPSTDANLIEVNCGYFVRDVWFFVCRFLLHSRCGQLHIAAMEYIEVMLAKRSFLSHNLTAHMDEIGKLLIACVHHVESNHLKIRIAQQVESYISMYRVQLKVQSLLDEAGDCKYLQSLRSMFETTLPKVSRVSVVDYIRAFLKPNRLERLHGLREYIAEHKEELQNHEQLLFELISRLIRMVRESGKRDNSLDAVKCLAEIGPLKMNHISYYFQTDFESIQQSSEHPMDQFISIIMETLERHLFDFNINTQEALVKVAGHVVNSKSGVKLLAQYPHLRIFYTGVHKSGFLNSASSIPSIDWLTVLKATQHLDYEPWMCTFMGTLFRECSWQGFDAYANQSFDFASACLQSFMKLLLNNKDLHLESLCSMLEHFFECSANAPKDIYQDKRVIKRFLYICECVRVVNNWSIPINLGNVVKAGNHCQAYFLSIMYLELWACSANAAPDANILADENFQMSAKMAYKSIGCLDAIPGFLNPLRSRVDYLSLNDNLSGILLESDNLDEPNSEICMDIMKSNGMLSFANLYQRFGKSMETDYETLWRLSQWDEQIEGHHKVNWSNNLEQEFNKQHYIALKSISKREQENTVSAINNAYQCVQEILRNISVECLQSVYKYMTWLCMLQQTEDFCQIQFCQQLASTQINEVFDKWQTELNLAYGSFSCKEQILSHQISLFKMSGTRANRRIQQYYHQSPVDTYLLKCIGECKAAGKLNLATKYISTLRGMTDITEPTKISVLLEDADVNVKRGNYQIAKAILHHVNKNAEFQFCLQRVPALRMQGEFLLDCNAESFGYTLDQKFNQSLKLLDHFQSHQALLMEKYPNIFAWDTFESFENQNRKAAHESIAKYADREYQRLHDYRQSQEYQTLVDIIQQNRRLAGTVTGARRPDCDRDRQIGALNLNRFAKLDEQELRRIDDNLTEHLCTAISHYIIYCQLDGGFSSDAIYRIIALWFTNDQNKAMLERIREPIKTVPSYKFICAVSQLAGRLNSKNEDFHKVLVDLLVRCGTDHPQQTFYKLYPLVYAYMDGSHSNTQRADIAKRIIKECGDANPIALKASRQFEFMFPALIGFANTYLSPGPNGRPNPKVVPDKLLKLSVLKMDCIQCPTLELQVQPSRQYNLISITKWTGEYSFCGGLNAPIKVKCLCSDGVVRAQLIKGKDDLRQDAVMQQVFGIVNELLNSDSQFIERKLHLRTYKVTPLSTRSGILEWCSNTIPVASYLVGDGTGGAHMKYRPNDWNNRKCRDLTAAGLKKSPAERRKIYHNICEHVKPVFHYFLLEKFLIPGEWFERRLAYINSVATTSMVGYVLGLGDRHTQNILIDEQTAEVVHIDFGIAFEQGKIQTTPETVPFRLTRDFVAPMGVCGTNGVFTKSCEAIMHILRRYKSVFTTILEVLLYDPLFIWGVLSKEQQQLQSNEESKNSLAQRALILVKYKLEGREPGLLDNSNVEAQVQRLINEATLPSNLAMLYHGWDPYL
ncbi:serine/threonine-protein kinase ATM [Drosophila virilis]|uniref:Serine/threonine-protein kinase ATM n=1 Tax=Drosophila virilis TaxID=7244 RepID=A0A0Q9W7S9_DROVI|nr:serine/threonine-protein kinase ATM [Drosophila virilis]KRF80861.1 uncharacterized protein Dvir_GJ14811, isoform C [Drosophila virilis]